MSDWPNLSDLLVAAGDPAPPTWDNLIDPLDDVTRWVSERMGPAGHLMSVAETKELRDAYNAVLPEITAFWTRLALNQPLWERIKRSAREFLADYHARHGTAPEQLRMTMPINLRTASDAPAGNKFTPARFPVPAAIEDPKERQRLQKEIGKADGEIAKIDATYRKMGRATRALDDSVGRLLDGLGSRADDTIVFYYGDHGGVLPRSKGYVYESGLRVPMAARWRSIAGTSCSW